MNIIRKTLSEEHQNLLAVERLLLSYAVLSLKSMDLSEMWIEFLEARYRCLDLAIDCRSRPQEVGFPIVFIVSNTTIIQKICGFKLHDA